MRTSAPIPSSRSTTSDASSAPRPRPQRPATTTWRSSGGLTGSAPNGSGRSKTAGTSRAVSSRTCSPRASGSFGCHALAVAHAALRNPDLPVALLDGPARELRLLVDHREDLVAERTRCLNRLRWHLHELDASWDPPARSLTSYKNLDAIAARLTSFDGPVARIAAEIVEHARHLTVRERALEREITGIVNKLAPTLLALAGVGALTAAKIVAETADVRRFKHKDAYARHNGTAPLPVWSGNRERHRLSRTGNRQLNAAIHRIAITQARCHDDAIAYIDRRLTDHHNTKTEALRALKRRLSDVVYRALLADAQPAQTAPADLLAAAA